MAPDDTALSTADREHLLRRADAATARVRERVKADTADGAALSWDLRVATLILDAVRSRLGAS